MRLRASAALVAPCLVPVFKDNALKQYVTVGLTVLAGAALFEAALIPGLVIGGAAILAPKVLPGLRRRLQPERNGITRRRTAAAAPRPEQPDVAAPNTATGFGIKQAVAKTITFRVIVTTLDFTTNYVVIGELTTAAGLSTFNTIAGPLFYLAHEAAWNYLAGSDAAVDVPGFLPGRRDANDGAPARRGRFTISRALAKTITYRTIATAVDFTTNYVVVGDVVTAAGLSAFGFVLGPFVYYGHEWVWDYYGSRRPPRALIEAGNEAAATAPA
jgi:uncharacterized membrane protein